MDRSGKPTWRRWAIGTPISRQPAPIHVRFRSQILAFRRNLKCEAELARQFGFGSHRCLDVARKRRCRQPPNTSAVEGTGRVWGWNLTPFPSMAPSAQTTPEMRRRPAMTTVNFSGFSCRLLDQGHETSSVSAYLGTISSPARYTELSPDRFKKVLAELTMLKASWPSSWQLPLFLCRAWTERSSTRCVVLWACMPHEVPIS